MGLSRGFVLQLCYLACVCFIFQTATNVQAQSQQKRSSRITSSRSFGTNVKASASNGINFDCPEEFGYYPHPTDCTQYYVCVFGGALLESCTGGLMYSHELQTCDWPRNVGCEVVDSGAGSLDDTGNGGGTRAGKQQQQQQQQQSINSQHVPSRIRFGSAFSSPAATTQRPKATVPPQYHRQSPQVVQAQVQSLPQHAGTVTGARGQPKPFDTQEDIAKLYADAHETLPPVEEEESDRQQRVYRGQPSTVSQVQRDRDGIIHQANINAIPNHGKIGSYTFGSQFSSNHIDLNLHSNNIAIEQLLEVNDLGNFDLEAYGRMSRDLNTEETAHKRVKRDMNLPTNDDTKIIFNTGEVLKTDENPKTLGEPRVLEYNTGEILKTEEDQKTLERPNIIGYLNTDEIYQPTVLNPKPNEHQETAELAQIKVANKQTSEGKLHEEMMQTNFEPEDNMQGSVMEIVAKILEELKGDGKQLEKINDPSTLTDPEMQMNQAALSETATSNKRIDEPNITIDTAATNPIPDSAADPIMETLNSIAALLDMDTDANNNDTATAEARQRGTRQLHQFFNGRSRFQIQNVPGTHYRSIDGVAYQQQPQQPSFNFGAYNPYLSPPTTSANYNQLSPGYQVYPAAVQQQRPQSFGGQKQKFTYTAALNPPPPPSPTRIEDDFRPMAANYYQTTSTLRPSTLSARRPNLFNNPELIPYILQSLREYQEQRKKMQQENFQYFHLDNQPGSESETTGTLPHVSTTVAQTPYFQSTKRPTKVTPNSHYAQFSTVGGFYNNKHSSPQQDDVNDFKSTAKYPSKLVSQYSIIDNYIPTTTESNYFNYNILGNQKIKGYFSTSKPAVYESSYQAGTALRYTTPSPPTSNINIISAPNLAPFHTPTTTKLPKYNTFSKYPEGLTFSNNSSQFPESYQVFSKVRTTTISPKLKTVRPTTSNFSNANAPQPSRKPNLALQFNVPEFVASLQSSDLTNMNPQVVNMIKYFKQLNTPVSTRKPVAANVPISQVKRPIEQYEEQIEATTEQNRQRPTVETTKRPTKGYEDFLKSIPNQAHKFNLHSVQQVKPFTSTSTSAPDYYDEYEEEEEPIGTDTDDDIMPPSQMPPYMPMSETMAPPRPQFMPPVVTTTISPHLKPSFQTGYIEATTTRRPFGDTQFQQFYQTGNKQNNQIPSFINFPSDIFQEIKQRLPPKPQWGSTAPNLTHSNNNKIHLTTAKTTTTPTPRTTTIKTTTTTTTTTTTQRARYTVRPNRHRGQNKWQSNSNANKELNNIEPNSNNDINKSNKTDFGAQNFRKRPAATPASSALGSLQLNVNMQLDTADGGQRYTC